MGFGVLLVGALIVKSAPRAWRHVQILYWQRQAMNYAPPASKIVYDEDPVEAAKLRAADHSLITGRNGEVIEFAEPWDRLYQLISPPGRRPAATLFLHERTNDKGERRLVVVELRPVWVDVDRRQYPAWKFECTCLSPGGLFQDPRDNFLMGQGGEIGAVPIGEKNTKWYAGQTDNGDPSHFTIRGLRNGAPVSVEGWLRDDHVVLDVRQ